jgi:hypothetical protein
LGRGREERQSAGVHGEIERQHDFFNRPCAVNIPLLSGAQERRIARARNGACKLRWVEFIKALAKKHNFLLVNFCP